MIPPTMIRPTMIRPDDEPPPDDTAPMDDTGGDGDEAFDNPGDTRKMEQDDDGGLKMDMSDASDDNNQEQEFYLVLVNDHSDEATYTLRYIPTVEEDEEDEGEGDGGDGGGGPDEGPPPDEGGEPDEGPPPDEGGELMRGRHLTRRRSSSGLHPEPEHQDSHWNAPLSGQAQHQGGGQGRCNEDP